MPAPPRVRGKPRQITMEPFKRDAPIGTYDIDRFAASVPWRDGLAETDAECVQQLRLMVANCGYDARVWAAHDEGDVDRRADAVQHLTDLGKIETLCRRVAGRDVEPFQHHLAIWPSPPEPDPNKGLERAQDAFFDAGADLEHISRLAAELASAVEKLRRTRPIGRAFNPTSAPPLIHRFVWFMGISWHALTGLDAPQTMAYARLLDAAWSSLSFPVFANDADPVGTFLRIHKAKTHARK